MIPLDNLQNWLAKLNHESTLDVFNKDERSKWDETSMHEKRGQLTALFEKPADFTTIVYSWYFRNKWAEALRAAQKQAPIRLLELASGSNDVIPRAMSFSFYHPDTAYVTANTNKALTNCFREITKNLPIKIDIIEDDAKKIEDYAANGSFDAAAFEHAVNDIIFDMLARKKGLDTVNIDWFALYPDMIRFVNEEYTGGTMEASVKEGMLDILSSCLRVLKSGSYIIINHFMIQYDLDRGINRDFWENLLPIIRKWVNGAGIGQEAFFNGFEPQWWMFIRKR